MWPWLQFRTSIVAIAIVCYTYVARVGVLKSLACTISGAHLTFGKIFFSLVTTHLVNMLNVTISIKNSTGFSTNFYILGDSGMKYFH